MPEAGKRRTRQKDVNLDALGLEMGNKPPQALDVEEAVIGALLVEPNCVDEAMEELSPSCFYNEKHRLIFESMVRLVNGHTSIDLLTVSQQLKIDGNLEIVGGTVALAQLSEDRSSCPYRVLYQDPEAEMHTEGADNRLVCHSQISVR